MQQTLLNLKYRPRKFSDVLGQEHIAKILKKSIQIGKLAPAYLLVGPTGSGKCVTGDTWIRTSEGIRQIKDVVTHRTLGFQVPKQEIFVLVNGRKELVSALYYGGIKRVKRVVTESGNVLKGTLEHPVLVWDPDLYGPKWKKLAEVTEGDYLVRDDVTSPVFDSAEEQLCPKYFDRVEYIKKQLSLGKTQAMVAGEVGISAAAVGRVKRGELYSKEFKQPELVDEAVAYYLGLAAGDGMVNESAGIMSTDPEIIDFVVWFHFEYFGVGTAKTYDKRSKKGLVRLVPQSSDKYNKWVREIWGDSKCSFTKCTPQVVKNAPFLVQIAFLKGLLDTDGSADKRGRIELGLASANLVDFAQNILSSLGFRYKRTTKKTTHKDSHRLCVHLPEVQKVELFKLDKKRSRQRVATRKDQAHTDYIPGSGRELRRLACTKRWTRVQRKECGVLSGLLDRGFDLQRTSYKCLEQYLAGQSFGIPSPPDWSFDKVVSITDGEEEVFDLTNNESHSFVANGFVVHNTTTCRVFAMAMLCEDLTDGEPCGKCDICVSIIDGDSTYYRETDAASNGSIDDMRLLVEQSAYGTLHGKRNVVVIDECFHSSSRVLMEDGSWRGIGSLVNNKVKARVMAYSFEEQKLVPREITGYLRKKRETEWRELEFVFGRKINCTVNHEFFTPRGKLRADELRSGDTVWEADRKLSNVQLQCVLGSLLGDATLGRDPCNRMARFIFKQSDVQREYACLKEKIMKPFVRTELKKIENGGWGDFLWVANTVCKPEFDDIWRFTYLGRTKKGNPGRAITKEWLNKLDVLGLAFWFMDDGHMTWNWTKTRGMQSTGGGFASHNFTKNENEILIQWLETKWGIKSVLCCDKRGKGYYIRVRTQESRDILLSFVLPYVHRSFQYKVGDRVCGTFWDTYQEENEYGLVPSKVRYSGVPRTKYVNEANWVYCLEVEKDHNFICEGKLVSNCHMLSKAAQNAVLKLLENGSRSTTYIFATTEREKMLHTVRARCMELVVRPISTNDITNRLEYICKAEGIPYERVALEKIALHSKTHVRDAINMMEQSCVLGGLTEQNVEENLNLDLDQKFAEVLVYLKNETERALNLLEELQQRATVGEIYRGLAETALAAYKVSLGIQPKSLVEKEQLEQLISLYSGSLLQIATDLTKGYQKTRSGLVCDLLRVKTIGATKSNGSDLDKVEFKNEYQKMQATLETMKIGKQNRKSRGKDVNPRKILSDDVFAKLLGGELVDDSNSEMAGDPPNIRG